MDKDTKMSLIKGLLAGLKSSEGAMLTWNQWIENLKYNGMNQKIKL
jgi:hypothetical protein